jgi:hypothetical protein
MIRQLHSTVDIDKICREGTLIDQAVANAARDARLLHKRMGVPLVVWQDGKIVEIPPEEIVVDLPAPPAKQ